MFNLPSIERSNAPTPTTPVPLATHVSHSHYTSQDAREEETAVTASSFLHFGQRVQYGYLEARTTDMSKQGDIASRLGNSHTHRTNPGISIWAAPTQRCGTNTKGDHVFDSHLPLLLAVSRKDEPDHRSGVWRGSACRQWDSIFVPLVKSHARDVSLSVDSSCITS